MNNVSCPALLCLVAILLAGCDGRNAPPTVNRTTNTTASESSATAGDSTAVAEKVAPDKADPDKAGPDDQQDPVKKSDPTVQADDVQADDGQGVVQREATDGSASPDSEETQPEGRAAAVDPRVQRQKKPADNSTPKPPKRKPLKINPNGTTAVTFDDLRLEMPVDSVFKQEMLTDQIKKLKNKRIRIKGFIHAGTVLKQSGIKQFLLLKNTECLFGPGGQAHCIMNIQIPKGSGIAFTVRPITAEGVFTIEPYEGVDGNTWMLYKMVCDKVK